MDGGSMQHEGGRTHDPTVQQTLGQHNHNRASSHGGGHGVAMGGAGH
jgi:hypothetical protein